MGRISRGFRLASISWSILKVQPDLLVLPIIAAVAQAVVAVTYISGVTGWQFAGESRGQLGLQMFPLYVATTIIATYANAALVSVADDRLRGINTTLGEGLRRATKVLPALIGWALLTATVGVALRAFQERVPLGGRIVAAIAGIAWSVLTMLVVPVLVLEKRSPLDAVQRSSALFRARWGEALVSDSVCSLAVMVCAIPLFLLALFAVVASPVLGIMLMIVVIGGVIAVSGALNGLVLTAAYRLAADGSVGNYFTANDLSLQFRPRKKR
jgi:hypothetical protein